MQRQWPEARRDRQNDHQTRSAGVERIDRDNQNRPASALFVPERRIEISQPDFSALR
jgi:hypothetical protein